MLFNLFGYQVCIEFPSIAEQDSPFIKGCSNFQLKPIKTHAESVKHILRAFEASSAKKRKQASTPEAAHVSEADQILIALTKDQQEKLEPMWEG